MGGHITPYVRSESAALRIVASLRLAAQCKCSKKVTAKKNHRKAVAQRICCV